MAGFIFMYFIFSRKKAENALAKSERESRELVETANSIILRWKPDGLVTFINKFGLDFFGYETHELVGNDVIKIFPNLEKGKRRDLEALVTTITFMPENYSLLPSENVKKNGEPAYIAWTHKAINDEAGNIKEILAIGNDITQLKNVEEEYRILAENSPAAIANSTLTGNLLYGNEEF